MREGVYGSRSKPGSVPIMLSPSRNSYHYWDTAKKPLHRHSTALPSAKRTLLRMWRFGALPKRKVCMNGLSISQLHMNPHRYDLRL
jgi:hypothetical protein